MGIRGVQYDRDPNLNALDISVLNQLRSLTPQPLKAETPDPIIQDVGLEFAIKELMELEAFIALPQEHPQYSEES